MQINNDKGVKKINKKIYTILLALLVLTIFLVLWYINRGGKDLILESHSYNHNSNDYVVYISEGDELCPYLVIDDNYNDMCILLREDLLDTHMSFDEKSSYYANSKLDSYLNNEFYHSLSPNLQKLISETNIEIVSQDSIGNCGNATETIKRRIFLLSCTEVGLNDNSLIVSEGEKINFFDTAKHLIAFQKGLPSSWWLRSSYTWYRNSTWSIAGNGKIGSGDVTALNGIRPAFCLDKKTIIKKSTDIKTNKKIYVIE